MEVASRRVPPYVPSATGVGTERVGTGLAVGGGTAVGEAGGEGAGVRVGVGGGEAGDGSIAGDGAPSGSEQPLTTTRQPIRTERRGVRRTVPPAYVPSGRPSRPISPMSLRIEPTPSRGRKKTAMSVGGRKKTACVKTAAPNPASRSTPKNSRT